MVSFLLRYNRRTGDLDVTEFLGEHAPREEALARSRRREDRPDQRLSLGTLLIMTSADGWDLTVPEDAAELLAELRRHGVRPGQRLHVVPASDDPWQQSSDPIERPVTRTLDFIGSVHGGPADLSTRTDDYLRRGFGRE